MRTALVLFILLVFATPVDAMEVESTQLVPVGYCQLTTLSSATALSSCAGGIPTTAQIMIAVSETQALRWRDDGTSPTATVGMPVAIGTTLLYQADLTKIKFIEQTSGGILNAAFYRYQ